MKNIKSIKYLGVVAVFGLASCSSSYSALKGESDDLYFMASDAEVATEFAVQNNNAKKFKELKQINPEEFAQESFSAKNVNPEYIAKYQSDNASNEAGTVYFDDAEGTVTTQQGEGGDINIYNNFRGNTGNSNFNSPWMMNPWMMSSMYMGGFSPWGMYDPFWGPGFGFRPGLSLSLGFGMGYGFGSRFGMGFGNPWRYGYGSFYDPFYNPYYGYGYGYGFHNRPIIVIPGGESQRQIVRGARPTRGSSLATTGRTRDANVANPSASRSTARREALSRTSTPTSRAASRSDFSRSQNDYYNNASERRTSSASASPTRRSVNSPAMDRTGNASRSAYTSPARSTRTQAPATINRSTDSRNQRYAAPSRSTSPSYNRSTSPQYRSTSPANNSRSTFSSPSRSNNSSPAISSPSRSSGSSGGGVSRSTGSSRRGN